MCGIVGHLDPGLSPETSRTLLENQVHLLKHRGPDGKDFLVGNGFGLGHARLAIIDLETGSQPMTRQGLSIVFNGEIYNYLELKKELEIKGHNFETQSDTEVILVSFKEWGCDAFSKLNGMFALAIYDHKRNTLIAARDPYGQKPFFYWQNGEKFYFASEARCFSAIASFPRRLSVDAIAHHLAFEALYFDQSIYENLKKLPPGHFLIFKEGKVQIETFFKNLPRNKICDENEATAETLRIMKDAVRISFRADVSVGILLSGGLDSSMVLALLREAYPEKVISSFTIQNQDPSFDESHYAQQAANLFGTTHHNFSLSLADIRDTAMQLPEQFDEPLADPGVIPRFLVTRELRQHMKVALTGDGGDEFFYGYLVFKAQQLSRWMGRFQWVAQAMKPALQSLPTSSSYMAKDFLLKQFLKGYPSSEAQRNYRWTSSFLPEELNSLITARHNIEKGLQYLETIDEECKESGPLGRFAYKYQRGYLPEHVLTNADRTGMLNSVELRSPLLDTRLTQYLNLVNDQIKMPGLKTKFFMKKLAKAYLPEDLIERKKVGFTVPMAHLLRTELREDVARVFHPKLIQAQGIFNASHIAHLVERHNSGKENLYKPIWTLYSLQKWLLKNNGASF